MPRMRRTVTTAVRGCQGAASGISTSRWPSPCTRTLRVRASTGTAGGGAAGPPNATSRAAARGGESEISKSPGAEASKATETDAPGTTA